MFTVDDLKSFQSWMHHENILDESACEDLDPEVQQEWETKYAYKTHDPMSVNPAYAAKNVTNESMRNGIVKCNTDMNNVMRERKEWTTQYNRWSYCAKPIKPHSQSASQPTSQAANQPAICQPVNALPHYSRLSCAIQYNDMPCYDMLSFFDSNCHEGNLDIAPVHVFLTHHHGARHSRLVLL